MNQQGTRVRVRALAAVTAAVLAFSGASLVLAPAAHAATSDRVSGADRYATASAVAAKFSNVTDVIVASGLNFPDAVAAGGLAGVKGAPVLLTDPNTLSSATASRITAMNNPIVHILGGTGAVSTAVENELKTKTNKAVNRISGADRFETACAVAAAHGAANVGSLGGKKTAIVATGMNFPDALAVGTIAYSGKHPILLVQTNSVPSCVTSQITALGIQQVVIAGGTGVVSSAVQTQLETQTGSAAIRRGGSNRFGTAALVADTALASFGFTGGDVLLAYGLNFPDALAAGPYGGSIKAPILLASSVPPETETWLQANASKINKVTAIGGTGVISDATLSAATADATPGAPTTNQTYTVSPNTVDTKVVSVNDGTNDNRGSRAYTASTGSATSVDIALFPAENVKITSGIVTIETNTQLADSTGVSIEVVNGAANVTAAGGAGDAHVNNVVPQNGQVTFSLDSTVVDQVVPIVWADANNDNVVNIGANKQPTEAFGLGGEAAWIPPDAQGGAFTIQGGPTVTQVNKTAKYFVGDPDSGPDNALGLRTYRWDSNDTFQIGGVPSTLANFEANISTGDTLLANSVYATDTAASSVFNLGDVAPAAPASLTASNITTTGVTLTVPTPAAGVAVRIYQGLSPNATRTTNNSKVADTTTDADTSTANFQVAITGLTENTTYEFWASYVQDGDESALAPASDTGTLVNTATAPAPRSTAAAASDGAAPGAAGLLDINDTLTLQFDREVTLANNASVTLRDDDGTEGVVTCGSNASCSLSGANKVVTMVLSANPSINNIGGTAGLDHGSTAGDELAIQTGSGISNNVGAWNLPGSGVAGGIFSRVVNGANSDLNAALGANTVTANPTNEVFRSNGTGLTANDVLTVYSVNGTSLGSFTAAGGAQQVTTSGFASGDTLFVLLNETTSPGRVNQSLQVSVGPWITAAAITTAGGNAGFCNDASDVLTVTFSETPALAAAITGTNAMNKTELDAVLGLTTGCNAAWTGTVAVVGSTITITSGGDVTGAQAAGSAVPGTVNTNITNAAGTGNQQANVFATVNIT